MPILNLTNQRFGKLVVKSLGEPYKNRWAQWHCICDCGTNYLVRASQLRSGKTKSCGCLKIEKATIHGMSRSKTYTTWLEMHKRCYNKDHEYYPIYGGRGICVSPAWHDFPTFLADMGERPKGKTLDRINPNGHYEAGNCRWATNAQQARNKRNNVLVVFKGVEMCLADAAALSGISFNTLKYRLTQNWPEDKLWKTKS